MRWHRKLGVVTHVFTHFPLELVVYIASLPPGPGRRKECAGCRSRRLQDEALPNVMRKVIAHGLGD